MAYINNVQLYESSEIVSLQNKVNQFLWLNQHTISVINLQYQMATSYMNHSVCIHYTTQDATKVVFPNL